METKPGILTTEFWGAMIASVMMILIATGTIGDVEAETFSEMAGGLVAAALPIATYIWSRTKVKTSK